MNEGWMKESEVRSQKSEVGRGTWERLVDWAVLVFGPTLLVGDVIQRALGGYWEGIGVDVRAPLWHGIRRCSYVWADDRSWLFWRGSLRV